LEDRVGDRDLAEVVEQRAELDGFDREMVEPEALRDRDGAVDGRREVRGAGGALRLERAEERADDRDVCLGKASVGLLEETVELVQLRALGPGLVGARDVQLE